MKKYINQENNTLFDDLIKNVENNQDHFHEKKD